jgi:hypothetical protein
VTDWLRHELAVSGRPTEVAAFRRAAAGANIVPWELDLEAVEEGLFLLLMRAGRLRLSVGSARAFATHLRAGVDHRHGALCAWIGRNRACLLDLHALVPIPSAILARGPDAPASRTWLWEHWGTVEPLRHVREMPPRPGRRRGLARFRVEFYAADWTPWRALQAIRARWPALRFEVWPDYGQGGPDG